LKIAKSQKIPGKLKNRNKRKIPSNLRIREIKISAISEELKNFVKTTPQMEANFIENGVI